MILTWRARRQLAYIGLLFLLVLTVGAGIYFFMREPASCQDKRKNQNETDIDCGGACAPCLGETSDPLVLWTRSFSVATGRYDVVALLENKNLVAGAALLRYRFKLFDERNILIAVRAGTTFLGPKERFILFESNVETGFRVPARVTLEFDPISWVYAAREESQLLVAREEFVNEPFGRLAVDLRNTALEPIRDIIVQTVLFDRQDNAFAASVTKLDHVAGEGQKKIFFTWPNPFPVSPERIDIFIRTPLK